MSKGRRHELDNELARRGQGRPRSPVTDQLILDAARKMLATGGFDALNFEALAQAAGVSRPTIYRRWPTKALLVNEIAHGGDTPFPARLGTEGLRAAITALLRNLQDRYSEPAVNAATLGAIVARQKDPTLGRDVIIAAEESARRLLEQMVEQGKAEGLIRRNVDPTALFDMVVGTILYRNLFSVFPPDPGGIAALVDLVIKGIAPGGDGDDA